LFNRNELLLANEASLTSSLLGNGLNALRQATIYNKGLYYQAFFSLSIGIERLLKIIIICKYRCKHDGQFPENISLKDMGHDLIKLCQYNNVDFKNNMIHTKLIAFLNNFAKNARYYNVDSMIGKTTKHDDPLAEWAEIENDIIYTIGKRKNIQNKEILAQLMDGVMIIRQHDLHGNAMTNSMDLLTEFEDRDTIKGYPVQYIFEIITKLVEIIRRLEREMYLMPVLSEFFVLYNKHLRPFEIRKKKNWLKI